MSGEIALLDSGNADTRVLAVTVDEMLTWKDDLGRKAFEAFGRRGAHANAETYARLRDRCLTPSLKAYIGELAVPLNSFSVHVAEGVPDGLLVPCNCGK